MTNIDGAGAGQPPTGQQVEANAELARQLGAARQQIDALLAGLH